MDCVLKNNSSLVKNDGFLLKNDDLSACIGGWSREADEGGAACEDPEAGRVLLQVRRETEFKYAQKMPKDEEFLTKNEYFLLKNDDFLMIFW